MALPFVPENETMDLLREISQYLQTAFCIREIPGIADFLRYYYGTWLEAFMMRMWNVFNRPSNLRTTNHCEDWNQSWNAQTRRSSPNIWSAMRFIKIQQKK